MIPFTQYLLPDGRKREGGFDRSPEIEALAFELIERGAWFDAEVLTTGEVSLTCEREVDDDREVETLAIEVVLNGPGLPEAVDALVKRAHTHILSENV